MTSWMIYPLKSAADFGSIKSAPTTVDEVFWWVENYLGTLNYPFKAIRVYRRQELIVNEDIEVR